MRTRPESGAYREIAMKSTATSMSRIARREVGEEDQRALEHADEHDAVGMVGRDLAAEPLDELRDRRSSSSVSGANGGGHSARVSRDRVAQEDGPQAATERGQLDQLLLQPDPGLGVALAHVRHQHLAEQHRFALGEGAVHAQVAGLDAAPEEPGGDRARPRARRRRSAARRPISRAGEIMPKLSSSATCAASRPAAVASSARE